MSLTFKKEVSFGIDIIQVFNPDKDYLGYIKKEGNKWIYLPNPNTSYELECQIEIGNKIMELQLEE